MQNPIAMCRYAFLVAIMICSCEEKIESPPLSQSEIWRCHHDLEWDEITTRDALIGVWELEFIGCYFSAVYTEYVSDQRMTIEFRPDSTLIVQERDSINKMSRWEVVDGDADLFELNTKPSVGELSGRILFCDDRVEFNLSYADICDHWFKRKE